MKAVAKAAVAKTSKTVFSELLAKAMKDGRYPVRSQKAREWLRDRAKKESVSRKSLFKEQERLKSSVTIGCMYFFKYDPKTKDDLPYYDKFPLVFPVDRAPGGFYGINFHYLPPFARAKLMDALYTLVTDDRQDAKTKLAISYKILKAASKFKLFKPCFKHYLSSHVQSSFIKVAPQEWDIALFLPVAQFQKEDIKTIYKESMEQV